MNSTRPNPLVQMKDYGQSLWMDSLSRDLLRTGELQTLVESGQIQGLTSNPAIFEKAIVGNAIYNESITQAVRSGQTLQQVYETLVFADIREACDLLRPIYEQTEQRDGYVSIEVSPALAHDTGGTVAEGLRFFQEINRPNLMIKVPGTPSGFGAIERLIAEGVNVNITLLFSVESYLNAAWAYLNGLEARLAAGLEVRHIASVASFFISRIDSAIDAKLEQFLTQANTPEQTARLQSFQGKAAIANAKMAYKQYQMIIASPRWQAIEAKGGQRQRLLWASTSTKNPAYPDTIYVEELIGPDTVNTLPPATLKAYADHGQPALRLASGMDAAAQNLRQLQELGINLEGMLQDLLVDGIQKFMEPFQSLMNSLEERCQGVA